jgi:hypothetical protein
VRIMLLISRYYSLLTCKRLLHVNKPRLLKSRIFVVIIAAIIHQEHFSSAEATNGIGKAKKATLSNLSRLSRDGFVKLMTKSKLDALVIPDFSISSILAIGGFPGISVLADHDTIGAPFGICFRGLKGSEPKLIEMAYGLEQASKIRKPHALRHIISYAPAQESNFFFIHISVV